MATTGRRWARYPRMAMVRLTEEEHAAVLVRAVQEGTTMAGWIRAAIAGGLAGDAAVAVGERPPAPCREAADGFDPPR